MARSVRSTAAVIVPFHHGRAALERVLTRVAQCADVTDTIVVANGSTEDLSSLAAFAGVRVIALPTAVGPAAARNRGAAATDAPILAFVDADVVPHLDAIPRMVDALADGSLAAVFGAYDHHPPERNFFSQYRNLGHAFVHEQAHEDANTFWAGLGAVRASAFGAVGGFDERFIRPSIEDIELGYRLSAAGYRLRLDVRIRGTHLKRWTLRSAIVTDVRDRGVLWTQALLKFGAVANDLNISWAGRAAVALAYAALGAAAAAARWPAAVWLGVVVFAGFAAVQGRLLRSFVAHRGLWFAVGALAAQFLHHLCNGVSLAVGVTLWTLQRVAGVRTRWTLPRDAWTPTP